MRAMMEMTKAFLAIKAIPKRAITAKAATFNLTNPRIGRRALMIFFFLPRASETNDRTDDLTSSGMAPDKLRAAAAISRFNDRSWKKFLAPSVTKPSKAFSRCSTSLADSTNVPSTFVERASRPVGLMNESPPTNSIFGVSKNSLAFL